MSTDEKPCETCKQMPWDCNCPQVVENKEIPTKKIRKPIFPNATYQRRGSNYTPPKKKRK